MVEPLSPSRTDIRNFLLGGTAVGAAFSAYKNVSAPSTIILFVFFGLFTLFLRELGQRVVGHWMEAEVELELSQGGTITTLFVALFSYISVFALIFLTPLSSSYSAKSYEHWGKSIDAIWAKRQYWLASSGITMLLAGWLISYLMDFSRLAELISLFTFFQLLPLDEKKKICGKLDGAYILLWTGFMWLVFMGVTVIAMILSVL